MAKKIEGDQKHIEKKIRDRDEQFGEDMQGAAGDCKNEGESLKQNFSIGLFKARFKKFGFFSIPVGFRKFGWLTDFFLSQFG